MVRNTFGKKPSEFLTRAAEHITVRGHFKATKDNPRIDGEHSPTCLSLAMYDVYRDLNKRFTVSIVEQAACNEIYKEAVTVVREVLGTYDLHAWNDSPTTTKEMVIEVLNKAVEKINGS